MRSLQDRRLWIAGGVVVALLIAAASWFLLISPKMSDADAARSQAAATDRGNDKLQDQVNELRVKSAHIGTYTSALQSALSALPPDSGLPAFTRQIATQAKSSHVGVESISVGAIAAPTVTSPTTTPSASASPSASSSSAPSASADTTGATATTGGAGSVFSIQITLIADGSYANLRGFLNLLQYAGPRHALIGNTQFAPVGANSKQSIDTGSRLTTQLTVYSAPQTPRQIAALRKLLDTPAGR